MKFDELTLDDAILAGVAAAGFEECTEVQAQAIPNLVNNRDVMVQSQTGTGKTAAFLLPTFQLILNDERYQGRNALIVAPTRELAVQIKEEADMLAENLPLKTAVFHGGVGYGQQERALEDGVNIMVGTPGRILDLSQTGKMRLKDVAIVVIDEADRLFDMGFYPDIRKMMRRMRPREERLNMLFSATLNTRVRNIAWEYMNDPVEIEVEPEQITVDTVQQTLYHVSSEEKMSVMLGLLKRKKPRNAIVFTNTKRAAEEVAKRLEINGYPSEFIIGDLPQKKRLAIIRKIKAGEAEYLVATDVAARGLHIDNLEMVINFDIPEDPEAYVHRIGRTARAGESGEAVALACERYVFGLEAIEKLINQKIPVGDLSDDLISDDASAGMRIRTDAGRGRDGGGRGRDDRRRDGGTKRRSDRRSPSGASSSHSGGDRSRGRSSGQRDGHSRRGRENRSSREQQKPVDSRRAPDRRSEVPRKAKAPKAGADLQERLEYYRQKYGEDFQPTDEMLKNIQNDEANRGKKRKKNSQGHETRRGDGARSGHGRNKKKQNDQAKKPESIGANSRSNETTARNSPGHDGENEKRDGSGKEQPNKKGILGRLKSFFG